MHSLLQAPLAIVDLETTGTRPASDRVTEIGVLEIERFEVQSQWSTLVNPGVPVPSEVQALTGITREMLAEAPRFADLAEALHERLAGRVFVAHTARSDYASVRREFDRAGIKSNPPAVCGVRLARRLYPRERGHGLDSLIARHGLTCSARHRAMGDAEALWQFLRIAAEEHGEDVFSVAARQVAKQPALPPQLDRAVIDAIPEAPGVYLFYGESGPPLYIGKSRSMRSRVLQHFYATAGWLQGVRRIDWQRTVVGQGACFRHQVGRCAGVCAGRESIHAHHGRLAAALATLRTPPWPYAGPIGIVESDDSRDATEVHAVDRWCYLGAARTEPEMADLMDERPRFDYDHYRILARYLTKCVGAGGTRVVPLNKCTASF